MVDCNESKPELLPTKRYRWLLFDADGTLFDFEAAERKALERAFVENGLRFESAFLEIYREINHRLWGCVEQGHLAPGDLKRLRFERLFEAIGEFALPEPFSDGYLRHLAGCSELLDEAEGVVRILGERYRIAILTNGLRAVQRPRFASCTIREYVTEIVISEEVGYAKPSRGFFDAAFARLGHPARSDVLLIGDSWSSDIVGGANYGIDTCWYNPGRLPRPAHPPIRFEIASLQDLPGWLENGSLL